jgi:DNA-binding response OmpR family regulator
VTNPGIPTLYPGGTPFLILVVDDEATMRRSLADILRLEGYRVQTAVSGEEAILRIKEEFYDLILLDLKMPGIGGIEVLHFAAEYSPDSQVILLTAHGSLESAIEALRLGAQDYLLKPSSPETILASVARGLKLRIEHLQYQELLSKLESSILTLQETKETNQAGSLPQGEFLIGDGVRVDFDQQVVWDDQNHVSLTTTESKLFRVLLENRGYVYTHKELVVKVYGYETTDQEAPATLRPLISRLRHKLSVFSGGQAWIVNTRGRGYGFKPAKLW